MALQFYFGSSGSGKSKRLHQDVLHMAAKDPDCNFLFLVPAQGCFEPLRRGRHPSP